MDTPALSLVHVAVAPRTPSARPPILVLLPGLGSDEHDLAELAPQLDPRFLCLSVRAPLPHPPGWSWYPIDFTPRGDLVADESAAPESRDRIARFVAEAVDAYGADPWRVYLLGFSQGASMALYTALTRAGVAAGVVVMSGRLVSAIEFETVPGNDGLPILTVHGTHDPVLPVEQGRAIRKFLETQKVTSTYREYPMGHQVSAESLADIDAWLTARLDESALTAADDPVSGPG